MAGGAGPRRTMSPIVARAATLPKTIDGSFPLTLVQRGGPVRHPEAVIRPAPRSRAWGRFSPVVWQRVAAASFPWRCSDEAMALGGCVYERVTGRLHARQHVGYEHDQQEQHRPHGNDRGNRDGWWRGRDRRHG